MAVGTVMSVVVFGVVVGPAAAAGAPIPWRTGAVEVPWQTPAEITDALDSLASRASGDRHVVVQLDRPVDDGLRAALASDGLELLAYVGENSFFAAVTADRLDAAALGASEALAAVVEMQPAWKLHPLLVEGSVPAWSVVSGDESADPIAGAYVVFHEDVPLEAGITVAEQHGAVVRDILYTINGLVIELPRSAIAVLAAEDAVQWIEPPLPRMSELNDSNRARTQVDLVQAAPYNLTGSGVNVLVYDGGTARATHVDFQGRLTVRDSSGMHYHSTHVAGTIGGAGVANATYKGMAPAVTMQSYGFEYDGSGTFLYTNPGDLQSDYNQAINTYGAVIGSNSIGTNVESNGFDCAIQGDYGVTDQLIDNIVRGSLGAPFRIVWAAGNERQGNRCDVEGFGDYYSSAPPAGAKNHICVGALNSNDDSMTSFSSWGPTDDGRMKPDISGPGCQSNGDSGVTSCTSTSDTAYTSLCGTSMACPTVAGCAALIIQDYRVQYPTAPLFRNSTLKIWLAHTAVDLGNAGPDYQYGYGSVRVKEAIDFMRGGSFMEGSVSQGGTAARYVSVASGTTELRVTMAWDDYPGTPNVNPALVNDLDLRVYGPTGTRYYPWTLTPINPSGAAVRTAENHRDNLEQVLVSSPAAGTWTIEVYGYNVPHGPQPFSLCATPALIYCSSQGIVSLNAARYACRDTANLRVVDCDLNANDNVVETVTITVTSTSEPAGESVLLTETGPATADFRGTIALSADNAPGVLQVAHQDTVTAHYIDADNGQGGYNIEVTASAVVDCEGPVISNVQVSNISSGTATITFTTNEAANGTVRYGLSCGALSDSSSETGYDTAHSVVLNGLPDASQIYFAVDAADEVGNSTTDDNGGACYTFTTPGPLYSWNMDTDPGWTISGGQWAWGQPTGGGGSAGNPDPASGYTGQYVYGYNLSGDYTGNMPEYHLTTTAINCSDVTVVTLKFWCWLGVQRNTYDHAYLRVSNDGTSWTTVWQNPSSSMSGGSWVQESYDLSSLADGQATVYIRWTMGTTNGSRNYCGWNIDDIEIWGLSSGTPDTTPPTPDPMTFASAPAP
ncbi:MAG TPA: S8 family serine peptidase, partial [Phycisphaerae bacterium]|nr:S8 family serine peptidase [Phycisphaerae bacterium]HNU46865.1 S8 family serine peptidase [Phycisphaerae bacterium]